MPSPQLTSRRVTLRPARFESREELRAALREAGLDGAVGAEVFLDSLPEDFGDADAAFMVDDNSRNAPVGACVLFGVDGEERSAQISVLVDGEAAPLGMGMETYVFFIGHVFAEWDVDRIYFWSLEDLVGMITVSQAVISEVKEPTSGNGDSSAGGAKAFAIEREIWERQGDRFRNWIMRGQQNG